MGDGLIGMLSGMFARKPKVQITAVNIAWKGTTHQLGGVAVKGDRVSIDIPFSNLPVGGSADHPQMSAETVMGIDVDPPFMIHSINPLLPISIANAKVVFKLDIGIPKYAFTGPVNLHFSSTRSVTVEINKVIVRPFGRPVEVLNDHRIFRAEMGKDFEFTIRLPASIDGKLVGLVTLSPPFDSGSSAPSPFTTAGQELKVTVRAPQFNYSGPMEIELRKTD